MKNLKIYAMLLGLLMLCRPAPVYAVNYEHYGQAGYISKICPRGGAEAQKLTQEGGDFNWGRNGAITNKDWAYEKYEKAIRLGDAAAANNLGRQHNIGIPGYLRHSERAINRFAVLMFRESIAMGCPEGYQNLANAYDHGWGIRHDHKKAMEMWRMAAEKGAVDAMGTYGKFLFDAGAPINESISEADRLYYRKAGLALMEESFRLGNGHIGATLSSVYYLYYNDAEAMIRILREGAKMGSMECLYTLYSMYNSGYNGQPKDEAYAKRIDDYMDTIDLKVYPKPIPNFDQLFPPKPVVPSKEPVIKRD